MIGPPIENRLLAVVNGIVTRHVHEILKPRHQRQAIPQGFLDECIRAAVRDTSQDIRQLVVGDAARVLTTHAMSTLWPQVSAAHSLTRILVHSSREGEPAIDSSAPIRVEKRILLTDVSDALLGRLSQGFTLLGDSCVLLEHTAGNWLSAYELSVHPADLSAANVAWERANASSSLKRSAAPNLKEPLLRSATFVEQAALSLCQGNQMDETGCYWYHSVWQLLRLADVVSTPTWHASFYERELNTAFGGGARRVLISGCADYGMLAHVCSALGRTCVEGINIEVADLCPTPLLACKWYARQLQDPPNLQTHNEDIVALSDRLGSCFDLVVTDAFLTRFPGNASRKVLDSWARLLRPNGLVITTVRLHDRAVSLASRADAVSDFVERAAAGLGRYDVAVGAPETFRERARVYAERMKSYRIGSMEEISEMALESGLSVVRSEEVGVRGELHPSVYGQIVMRKLSYEPI